MATEVSKSFSAQEVNTTQFLASEFLTLRLEQFKKLSVRTKKLVLEIVSYYLNTLYLFEHEAIHICSNIMTALSDNNELLMVECYKLFLEFLPVSVRAGIQGKNLFKKPSEIEQQMAHFYVNDIKMIQQYNQELHQPDESGFTMRDRILVMQATLEQELGFDDLEDTDKMNLQEPELSSP